MPRKNEGNGTVTSIYTSALETQEKALGLSQLVVSHWGLETLRGRRGSRSVRTQDGGWAGALGGEGLHSSETASSSEQLRV